MPHPTIDQAPSRFCHCGRPARENAYGHSCDQWPLCTKQVVADQAAFDSGMEYMCDLVDRIPTQIPAHRVTEAVCASLGRELDLTISEFCLDGKILGSDGEPFWPADDPVSELLDDWRYGPVMHGAYCPCGSRLEIRGELDAEDYEAISDFDYAYIEIGESAEVEAARSGRNPERAIEQKEIQMSLPTVAASAHGRHARTGPSVVPNWPGLVVRDPGTYTRLMAEQTSPVPAVVAGESPRGVSTDQPSLGEPICDNLADLLHRAADVLFASDAHCPALIAELRTRADRFAAVESVIGYGRGTAGE